MKFVMAVTIAGLAACGGPKQGPPPSEPASTTTTTAAALTVSDLRDIPRAVPADESPAPVRTTTAGDESLARRIRQSLERDETLKGVRWRTVALEIDDAHVTLRGSLPTLADSTQLERAVREVKGVRAVSNEITLPSEHDHAQ